MNNTNINIMMLRTLNSLRETGSISRTAEQLHVTQSAISHTVKALEKILNTPIVNRERRGVSLTAAGELASESANSALQSIDEILQLASASVSGLVNIAAINSASKVILSEVLVNIRKSHPKIEVNLFIGTDQEVEQWVDKGIADIGIAYNIDTSSSELLFEDEFFFITPFKKSKVSTIDLHDLDNKPIIVLSSGCELFIQEIFNRHNKKLKIKTTVSDTDVLFSIVSSGYGSSLIPGLAFPYDWKKLVNRYNVSPTLNCSLRMKCAQDKKNSEIIKILTNEIHKVSQLKEAVSNSSTS